MTKKHITATILAAALAFGAGSLSAQGNGLRAIADLFGDINFDGEVNAGDATAILQYSAFKGAGGTDTLEDWQGVIPQQGQPTPYAEGWIEQRAAYGDFNGDGIIDKATEKYDGYEYYLHLSGDYAKCYIAAYDLSKESRQGQYSMYQVNWEERDDGIYLTAGSSLYGVMCIVTPVAEDGTKGQAIYVDWTND